MSQPTATHRRARGAIGRPWRRIKAAVLERDNYTCQYCGEPATEPDHVIPRSVGGTDAMSNLVASCVTCNRSGNGAVKRAWLERQAGRFFESGSAGDCSGQIPPSAPEKRSRDW